MSALENPKHEHFAQAVSRGVSATKAYTSAGYSANGAKQSAARMLTNADLCSRLAELRTVAADEAATVAAAVLDVLIRKRSARVQVLQGQLDAMLAVQAFRAKLYADDLHGGATGQMAKDFRGKDGEVAIWKFDGALVAQIAAVMKQAAIEEGQWSEKREIVSDKSLAERLRAARNRKAAKA